MEVEVLVDLLAGVLVPKAVGKLERAEPPRFQSDGAGDRRRDFSLVLLREDRRSSRNHQRDTQRIGNEFHFHVYFPLPFVVKIKIKIYHSYAKVSLGCSGHESDMTTTLACRTWTYRR